MKKFLSLATFLAISVVVQAQFVLTPDAGLMTADGPYTIVREGTEAENYYAAKKAIENVIPNAEIGDVEYEKTFNVTSVFKNHGKIAGAIVATDQKTEYTLEISCTDGKIMISFKNIGCMEITRKGETYMVVYPKTGKNSWLGQVSGQQYLFNSKGEIAKQCKKLVAMYEDNANNLVKCIENSLK